MKAGMTVADLRAKAIAILKRNGWKPKEIDFIMGKFEGAGDVDAKIERVALDLCKALAALDWQISLGELRGKSAERRFAAPRGAAMWLAREIVGASFPAIGAYFHRDHSTVISAWRPDAGWRRIEDDRLYRATVNVMGRHRRRRPTP